VFEFSDDWMYGVVLVRPPTVFVRVLVPHLFDDGVVRPIRGHVISCSFHENRAHGRSRDHGFGTLLGQLGNVKALVLGLAGLISHRTSGVVISLALSLSNRTSFPPNLFTLSVALFAGPLVLSLTDLFSCLAIHSVVSLAFLIGRCAVKTIAGYADLVSLSTVVSPLIHAVLLVGSTVLTVLCLTVSLAAHAVVFLALVMFRRARLVVSCLAEVAAAHAIKPRLTDIFCRSTGHIPVVQASVFCQSTGTLIGSAARSWPRLTHIAIASCVNRHNVASFAES